MMKIQDIIEFNSGSPQFRIKEALDDAATYYTYYGQSEIENDLVDLDLNDSDAKKIRTLDKVNTVSEGDVLFSLISGKATLVRVNHQGYLFTQNYVKLIPKKGIDSKYLVYLLNENIEIKRQFQLGLQGSMVMKYTLKQMREIILPKLPSLKKQQTIGDLYFNQLRLQALKERVARTETLIIIEKLKEAEER